jgi:hypothetical protein
LLRSLSRKPRPISAVSFCRGYGAWSFLVEAVISPQLLPVRNSLSVLVSNCAEVLQKPVHTPPFFSCLGIVALALPLAASGQSGNFDIAQLGKNVGNASFTFTTTPDGYDSSSLVHVSMKGLNYALSKTEQLSTGNELKHVLLSATVNGTAVRVTAAPDAAQFLLNISANGRSTTTRLVQHPAAVFLPDFDPGALETLLALSVSHNNRDLWAILPKQSGTEPASIASIELATYADEAGTLDGKPIAVHHLAATIAGARTELFSGPENQLLQAELPQTGFALVRKGFILKPPDKPVVPAE